MKLKGWLVGAVIAGGVVYGTRMRGCASRPDPDEKLAAHITQMCSIARDNVESPERGVRELGAFYARHVGDMLEELGDSIAAIERISDDKKHDARARVMRDRLSEAANECEPDWTHFWQAVEDDPEASALMEHFAIRFNRTLEILLGEDHEGRLLHLPLVPPELERALR